MGETKGIVGYKTCAFRIAETAHAAQPGHPICVSEGAYPLGAAPFERLPKGSHGGRPGDVLRPEGHLLRELLGASELQGTSHGHGSGLPTYSFAFTSVIHIVILSPQQYIKLRAKNREISTEYP